MAGPTMPELTELLPGWGSAAADVPKVSVVPVAAAPISREWAWGGSTGEGARVCILDSGIDPAHPLVGPLERSVEVSLLEDGEAVISDADPPRDDFGHGTACAGIVRSIAPSCEIASVKVLGSGLRGSGRALVAGLRWALARDYDVVNLSLSTTRRQLAEVLRKLSDAAYFRRKALVASAHNIKSRSYPWRFPSLISVGSHDGADPLQLLSNPRPPVEFFARGVDVEVPWLGGETVRTTGNSFAAPHVSGICALILAKHPGLTPFELKAMLRGTSSNALTERE